MGLTNEHVGLKILTKNKIHVLTRAELLFKVCYEIPCIIKLERMFENRKRTFENRKGRSKTVKDVGKQEKGIPKQEKML